MPPKHLNFILLCALVSLACHGAYRFVRPAMVVGDALQLIEQHYIDQVDSNELMTAAMQGLTGYLDENSSFIASTDYESFRNSLDQEFTGIGIVIGYAIAPGDIEPTGDDESTTGARRSVWVITPLVGSPALEAGFLPGDEFMKIGGVDVSQAELREVSDQLRGQIDTDVSVVVRRNESELVSLTVRRQTIQMESVIGDHRTTNNAWVYRLQSDPRIAYIRLKSFGEKTAAELQAALRELDDDFDSLILDLRGNGGGLLYSSVAVCDMFLPSGRIVSTKIRDGILEDEYFATSEMIVDPDKPIVVLIDGNSASASEIVAACLQDHDRATIVGTRSFGKGTVQNILPLQFGRSALRLTVARYYRPNGRNIHRVRPSASTRGLQGGGSLASSAATDDEWGVSPDEGMEVPVDDQTLIKMEQQWREASYPLLKSAVVPTQGESAQDGPDRAGSDPQEGAEDLSVTDVDGPTIDPQLNRAIVHLRELVTANTSESQGKPVAVVVP